MITVNDICTTIEGFAPKHNAEEWDNVGLLVGRGDAPVGTVLTCLDADTSVVRQAIECGAQMIVSHHPLIFNPLKTVTEDTEAARTVLLACEHKIALYAAHTNLDATIGGLCDIIAQKLGLTVVSELTDAVPPAEHVCGRILSCDMTLCELSERVKAAYNLNSVRVSGRADKRIKTVAVCSGGGRGLVDAVLKSGADCYIAGDLTHADARRLVHEGSSYIEITHFDSEIVASDVFKSVLCDKFGDELCVKLADEKNPFQIF